MSVNRRELLAGIAGAAAAALVAPSVLRAEPAWAEAPPPTWPTSPRYLKVAVDSGGLDEDFSVFALFGSDDDQTWTMLDYKRVPRERVLGGVPILFDLRGAPTIDV